MSEEEAKMPNPIKIDPFTDTENNDFVPTVVNLVTDGTKANQLVTDENLAYAGMGSYCSYRV